MSQVRAIGLSFSAANADVPSPSPQRKGGALVPAAARKVGWSPVETRLLGEAIAKGQTLKQTKDALDAGGFKRTIKAIRVMAGKLGLSFAAKDTRGVDRTKITVGSDIAFLKRHVALGLRLDELVQAFAERGVKVSSSLVARRIHELGFDRPAPAAKVSPQKDVDDFANLNEEEDELNVASGLSFVSHETSKRSCALHLQDLIAVHEVPPADVPLREGSTLPQRFEPLNHSPGGSAAAACAEE